MYVLLGWYLLAIPVCHNVLRISIIIRIISVSVSLDLLDLDHHVNSVQLILNGQMANAYA